MDQDILVPKAQHTNRSMLPLSFQPTMPRPPRIRVSEVTNPMLISAEQSQATATAVSTANAGIQLSHVVNKNSVQLSDKQQEAKDEEDEITLSSSLIFHTEYYLTFLRSMEEYTKAIDPAGRKFLKFDRPDMKRLFADTRALCEAEGFRRVAVFVCGPPSLVNEVTDLSRVSKMSPGCAPVRFDCHAEVFDF